MGSGPVWIVAFTVQVQAPTTTVASTGLAKQGPGVEITLTGPSATANIPGSYNDPADLYGFILVFVAVGLILLVSKFVSARRRRGGGRTREAASR
jgi:hypothetical protein